MSEFRVRGFTDSLLSRCAVIAKGRYCGTVPGPQQHVRKLPFGLCLEALGCYSTYFCGPGSFRTIFRSAAELKLSYHNLIIWTPCYSLYVRSTVI